MKASVSPNRLWLGAPRLALITIAVVFVVGIAVVALAAGIAIGRPVAVATAAPTLPPEESAPAVDPQPAKVSAEKPIPPVVDPVVAPLATPAPAAPVKAAVDCPVGHLSGGVTGASIGPGPISTMPRITVTAFVRNDSNTRVIMFRNDTPDVKGYTASGSVAIIELYGKWVNTARDSFALQPGEALSYVTAWDVTQEQIDSVVALYASPDVGSVTVAWPTTEQLAFCRSPLPNAGTGTDFPY